MIKVTIKEDLAFEPIWLKPTPTPTPSKSGFDIPPGKALFTMCNYTPFDWNLNIGPYFLQVPANQPGRECTRATKVIDPGTYIWHGQAAGQNREIRNSDGTKAFEFTIRAGEVYRRIVY